MKAIYTIDTKNRFGQVLVFTDKDTAINWARKSTKWTEEEIEKNIEEHPQAWQGFYSLWGYDKGDSNERR